MKTSFLIGLVIALIQTTAYSQQLHVPAALCKIEVTNRTIRIVPWDSAVKKWETNSARVLSWDDNTRLRSGPNALTIAELAAGKRLSEDTKTLTQVPGETGELFLFTKGVKTLTDLHGQRGSLLIEKVDGNEVLREVDIVLLLAGELFQKSIMVGENDAFQAVHSPEVPCCDRKVAKTQTATRSSTPRSDRSNTEDAAVLKRLMERRQQEMK